MRSLRSERQRQTSGESEPYTLLVMTDSRDDCLLSKRLAPFASSRRRRRCSSDDTGDMSIISGWQADTRRALLIPDQGGFGSAIRLTWDHHLRRDQTPGCSPPGSFNRDIDIADMQSVLAADETLAQMLLMRQPWQRC